MRRRAGIFKARSFWFLVRRSVLRSHEQLGTRKLLGPSDLRITTASSAAVGAGDDVFSADEFSERDDAIGD